MDVIFLVHVQLIDQSPSREATWTVKGASAVPRVGDYLYGQCYVTSVNWDPLLRGVTVYLSYTANGHVQQAAWDRLLTLVGSPDAPFVPPPHIVDGALSGEPAGSILSTPHIVEGVLPKGRPIAPNP